MSTPTAASSTPSDHNNNNNLTIATPIAAAGGNNNNLIDPVSLLKPDETSVRVAVRVRPFLAMEKEEKALECVLAHEQTKQVQIGQKSFTFDRVYPVTAEQVTIFEESVMPLVDGAFNGYNATILAYGQTGSGKTYTMGSCNSQNLKEEELGVIPRVIEEVFKRIERQKNESVFTLKCSFIEIYNEDLRDLLDRDPTKSLLIREDPAGGICVVGVKEQEVRHYDELLGLLEKGSIARSTGSTLMNSVSSRSHAIFTLTIEQQRLLSGDDLNSTTNSSAIDGGGEGNDAATPAKSSTENNNNNTATEEKVGECVRSKFHFVDLAGSERLKRTQAVGARMKEGVSINQGLLALGNVISALGDEKKRAAGGAVHVPYRDAKLTRLLQDSLGGNSRTLMFACVSPADTNFEETLSTLKYANRARNIRNKPVVNRDVNTNLLHQLRAQIALLERELQEYRSGGVVTTSNSNNNNNNNSGGNSRNNLQSQYDERPVGAGMMRGQPPLEAKLIGLETEVSMLRLEVTEAQQALALLLVGEKENADTSAVGGVFDVVRGVERRLRLVLTGQFLEESHNNNNNNQNTNLSLSTIFGSGGGAGEGKNDIDEESTNQGDPDDEAQQHHEDEVEFAAGQRRMQGELADLDVGLTQKEKLLHELLQSRQQYEVLALTLEQKIRDIEQRSSQLNAEKEILSSQGGVRGDALETYNAKLRGYETELSSLRKKQKEHERLRRINEKNDERIAALQKEMEAMKESKTQLMKKMREESKTHREKVKRQDFKINSLQKEVTKDLKKISLLEKQTTRQQQLINRREEQLQQYQMQLAKSQESYIALARAKTRAAKISRQTALPPHSKRGGGGGGSASNNSSMINSSINSSGFLNRSSASEIGKDDNDGDTTIFGDKLRGVVEIDESLIAGPCGWVFDFVEQQLQRQHAAATLLKEKEQKSSLTAELAFCNYRKNLLENNHSANHNVNASAVANAVTSANRREEIEAMGVQELEDHIEYLNAEIEFKDMTIVEAQQQLAATPIDIQSQASAMDTPDARSSVVGLASELVRRGAELAKQAEVISELDTGYRETKRALMENQDRLKEMQKDFDCRNTALQSDYEEKVLFLLEQLRAAEAAQATSTPAPSPSPSLADKIDAAEVLVLRQQHSELQTELVKAKNALEDLAHDRDKWGERERLLASKLEVAEELRRRAETELRELRVNVSRNAAATATSSSSSTGNIISETTVAKLNEIWDEVGVSVAERQRQLEGITSGVTAISDHAVVAETQRRDSAKNELAMLKMEISALKKALGDAAASDGGGTSPRALQGLPLNAQLQKAKAQHHQLLLRQEALRTRLREQHARLQLVVAELGSDAPSLASDLIAEWKGNEVSQELSLRFDEALKKAGAVKAERIAHMSKTMGEMRELWQQLGADPEKGALSGIDESLMKKSLGGGGGDQAGGSNNDGRISARLTAAGGAGSSLFSSPGVPSNTNNSSSSTPAAAAAAATPSAEWSISQRSLREAEAKKARLQETLEQRKSDVESLELTLRCHWAALDIPQDEQERFQRENAGFSPEAIEAREKAICELQGMLLTRLTQTKEAVNTLWDELKVPQKVRDSFWENVHAEEVSLETLCALQIERAKLETKKQSLRVIVSLLTKRDVMLQRMKEFEEKASDPSRLFKGNSMERLEEERFRHKVSRDYPRIHESLKTQIAVWEQAYGERFGDGITGQKDLLEDSKLSLLHLKLLSSAAAASTSSSSSKDCGMNSPYVPSTAPTPPLIPHSSSASPSMHHPPPSPSLMFNALSTPAHSLNTSSTSTPSTAFVSLERPKSRSRTDLVAPSPPLYPSSKASISSETIARTRLSLDPSLPKSNKISSSSSAATSEEGGGEENKKRMSLSNSVSSYSSSPSPSLFSARSAVRSSNSASK